VRCNYKGARTFRPEPKRLPVAVDAVDAATVAATRVA
jgi:hypothetical protein